MELKERIAEALRVAHKSPTRVAAETGVSDSAISQLLSGKTKTLRADTAVRIESATGVRTSWLVTGKGVMMVGDSTASASPGEENGINVPLLANSASMGGGNELLDNDVLLGRIILSSQFVSVKVRPTRMEALRFIHAYGDSMEPTFSSGDILLVDSGVQEIKIDGIYVLSAHDRLFVKRVRQRIDGKFEISSDNPTHKTVDVLNGDHNVQVIGRVLWVWGGHKL